MVTKNMNTVYTDSVKICEILETVSFVSASTRQLFILFIKKIKGFIEYKFKICPDAIFLTR